MSCCPPTPKKVSRPARARRHPSRRAQVIQQAQSQARTQGAHLACREPRQSRACQRLPPHRRWGLGRPDRQRRPDPARRPVVPSPRRADQRRTRRVDRRQASLLGQATPAWPGWRRRTPWAWLGPHRRRASCQGRRRRSPACPHWGASRTCHRCPICFPVRPRAGRGPPALRWGSLAALSTPRPCLRRAKGAPARQGGSPRSGTAALRRHRGRCLLRTARWGQRSTCRRMQIPLRLLPIPRRRCRALRATACRLCPAVL